MRKTPTLLLFYTLAVTLPCTAEPIKVPAKPTPKVLFIGAEGKEAIPEVFAIDLETGKDEVLHTTSPEMNKNLMPIWRINDAKVSPDGKQLAYIESKSDPVEGILRIKSINDNADPITLLKATMLSHMYWSADGKKIYAIGDDFRPFVRQAPGGGQVGVIRGKLNWEIDVKTLEVKPYDFFKKDYICKVLPKSKEFVLIRDYYAGGFGNEKRYALALYKTPIGKYDPETLLETDEKVRFIGMLPDGKSFLAQGENEIGLFNIADEKFTPWKIQPERMPFQIALSPDGTKVLYLFTHNPKDQEEGATLWLCNIDGTAAKKVWNKQGLTMSSSLSWE